MMTKEFNAARYVFVALLLLLVQKSSANLIDGSGNAIPGTEGLELAPDVDLSNLNLKGLRVPSDVSIRGARFTNSNLDGAFIGPELDRVDFTNAIITNSHIPLLTPQQLYSTASARARDLHGIELSGQGFSWNLRGQNLRSATLGSKFENSDFTEANLQDAAVFASLTGSNFTNANVAFARFRSSNLNRNQLYSTKSYKDKNLEGIHFISRCCFFTRENYRVDRWDFSGQNLNYSAFRRANAERSDFSNASMRLSDLSFAVAPESTFANVDLVDGDLFRADLVGSDFTNANLANVDLRGAISSNAQFAGANIQNASLEFIRDLNDANFSEETTYNRWTVFPVGFDPNKAGLTRIEYTLGDFNGNQLIDTDCYQKPQRPEDFAQLSDERDGPLQVR